MRSLIAIQHYYTILLLCTLALLALVYDEGWIWPLKAAACTKASTEARIGLRQIPACDPSLPTFRF